MQKKEEKQVNNADKPKSLIRKIWSIIWKTFVGFILAFVLFIVSLSFSQSFRQYTLSKITAIANKFLIAEFEVQDIHFHTLNGIVLQEVRLITAGDTLAYIPEIEVNINYEKILINVIDINFVKLKSPRIKLLRSALDSTWNYTKIAPPSTEPDTTPPGKPPLIKVGYLELENAYFTMWDSASTWQPNSKMNFKKFELDSINLTLENSNIDIASKDFQTSIANLSAKELRSGLIVSKLKIDARLSKEGIEAKNTLIKIENTELAFDASMKKFNVFGESEEKDISNTIMSIDFIGNKIDPKIIDYFAIIPVKIGFVNRLELKAYGTLMDLNVDEILVDAYHSHIELTECKLTNLLKSKELTYETKINSTKIKYSDISDILQNINLSSVPNFKNAFIKNTKIYGTIDSVYSDLDIKTGIGSALGSAKIGFGKTPFSFDVDMQIRTVDLSQILNNNEFVTDLNCNLLLKGHGLVPEEITSEINIDIFPSHFNEYYFGNSKISASLRGRDTMIINDFSVNQIHSQEYYKFLKKDILDAEKNPSESISNIIISGGIGLKDISNPHFDIDLKLTNINLLSVLGKNAPIDVSNIPNSIYANMNIDMFGLNLDDLNGNFNMDFSYVELPNRSILPFVIKGGIAKKEEGERQTIVNISNILGEILELNITGKYTFSNLITSFKDHNYCIADFVMDKVDAVAEQFKPNRKKIELPTVHKFADTDIDINIKAKELSFINFFITDFVAKSAHIDAKIKFNSNNNTSSLNIDSINLKHIDVEYKSNDFKINNLKISGMTEVELVDSTTICNKLNLSIRDGNQINIANTQIDSLAISTAFDKNVFKFSLRGIYNSIMRTRLSGNFTIDDKDLELNINRFSFRYKDKIWRNSEPISAKMASDGITVNNLSITRDVNEQIFIKGNINGDNINNLNIFINNFELHDLNSLVLENQNFEDLKLYGKLDSLSLNVNGTFNNPTLDLDFKLNNIVVAKQLIGRLAAKFKYIDENLSGNAEIYSQTNSKLFDLNVKSLPIYIGLEKYKNAIIEDRSIDISVLLSKFPAQIISPFVPMVDNLRGLINGKLDISGNMPDKFTYKGELNLDNLALRLMTTNVEYSTYGKIKIETDKISFNALKIKNKTTDLKNGEALVNGKITLKEFNLDSMDFELMAKQFLVLSDQTEATMPWIYGNLIIATDSKPLRFYGTMAEPNLTGSVIIINSDLKMPQILEDEIIKRRSHFTYINKDTLRITEEVYIDTVARDSIKALKAAEKKANGADFADLLNIDLEAKIKRCAINMTLKNMVNIYVKIGTVNPMSPIRYVKNRTQTESKIYGSDLEVLDGSTVNFFRTMNAKGTISFPTARLTQPRLNLTAEAKGRMSDNSSDNSSYTNYIVTIYITGTADNPQVKFSYSLNGSEKTGDPKQTEQEATQLLVMGKLDNYSSESSLMNEGYNMLFSQMASKGLNEFLTKTGFVDNASLHFDGEGLNKAQLQISGNIGGFASWTLGGKFEDIYQNYTASIDIPINLKTKGLDNLMLQLSKSMDFNTPINQDKDATNWEVKLRLGGNW